MAFRGLLPARRRGRSLRHGIVGLAEAVPSVRTRSAGTRHGCSCVFQGEVEPLEVCVNRRVAKWQDEIPSAIFYRFEPQADRTQIVRRPVPAAPSCCLVGHSGSDNSAASESTSLTVHLMAAVASRRPLVQPVFPTHPALKKGHHREDKHRCHLLHRHLHS